MAAGAEGAGLAKRLARLDVLEKELEARGGHDVEHLIEALSTPWTSPTRTSAAASSPAASGAILARLLVSQPDVLLLDEPTNHLDAFMTDWLEDWFLETHPLVLVTHDRYLLERVVDRIVEVDGGTLHSYAGGYSDYLEGRAARLAAAERARPPVSSCCGVRRPGSGAARPRGPRSRRPVSSGTRISSTRRPSWLPRTRAADPAGPAPGDPGGAEGGLQGLRRPDRPPARARDHRGHAAGDHRPERSGQVHPARSSPAPSNRLGLQEVGETVQFMGIDQERSALDPALSVARAWRPR